MRRALGLLCCLCVLSCSKLMQQAKANEQPAPAASSATAEIPADKPAPAEGAEDKARSSRYALPFAWQTSDAEPMAKARAFLRDVLNDNQKNAARGMPAFKSFVDKETPRATVIACSDSRLHTDVWDLSPENDDFVVRNLGNQVPGALGSLAYGVEELRTPVLLVIGHTGCSAVQAAMNNLEGVGEPIKKELSGLRLPELKPAAASSMWAAAVTANVNSQVAHAVEHFGERIQEGTLIVLGAVYDFRNDLRGGPGKLHLVNVNANTEPERLKAFAQALLLPQLGPPSKSAEPSDARSRNLLGLPRSLGQESLNTSPMGPGILPPATSVPRTTGPSREAH